MKNKIQSPHFIDLELPLNGINVSDHSIPIDIDQVRLDHRNILADITEWENSEANISFIEPNGL